MSDDEDGFNETEEETEEETEQETED